MKFTLSKRTPQVPGVESFIFQSAEPLAWKPGQYLHYTLAHDSADDRGVERWFTISSAPFEGTPTITTRHAPEQGSSFKEKLFTLQVGDTIEADGLEGEFVIDDLNTQYVFIAGGIGITPFHSILKQADHDGVTLDVTLIYSSRDNNIVFKDELGAFASRNPNLKVNYLVAPQIVDEAAIRRLVPDLSKPIFYVSGPEPMVKNLAGVLEGMGIAQERIKLDDFPGYEAHQG